MNYTTQKQHKGIFMDNKAQAALEYLLLIAGAVVVAAVVIIALGGITNSTQNKTHNTLTHWLTHIS